MFGMCQGVFTSVGKSGCSFPHVEWFITGQEDSLEFANNAYSRGNERGKKTRRVEFCEVWQNSDGGWVQKR